MHLSHDALSFPSLAPAMKCQVGHVLQRTRYLHETVHYIFDLWPPPMTITQFES